MFRSELRTCPTKPWAKQDGKPPTESTMHYVYLIRSSRSPAQTYIGLTDDLRQRLKSHNEGANAHTSKFRPWELVCYLAFQSRDRAAQFEKYLKVGSGHAFAHRHLW